MPATTKGARWPSRYRRFPTTTPRSSRTSTRRRCASTTTSTTRRTSTTRTPPSKGRRWADKPVEHILDEPRGPPRGQAGRRSQQRRRAREPLALLGDHEPDGGGEPRGRSAGDRGHVRRLDALKQLVNDAGVKRFGSGWTWLVHDGTGLAVYSTANQDSPLLTHTPLLGIDVWEHAYYLEYQNRPPGLPGGVVERRQLGRGRRAVHRKRSDRKLGARQSDFAGRLQRSRGPPAPKSRSSRAPACPAGASP